MPTTGTDSAIAGLIVLAYFAGGLAGAAVFYYFQKRSEDAAFARHRKHKMEMNVDLEHIEEALRA